MAGKFGDVAKCARHFKIERRTLARRVSGMASKSTRRATNQRLTVPQENALLDYIRRLDKACMSPSPELITTAANYIIQKEDGLAPPVGQNWFSRFHTRHPELFKRRQKPLATARKDAFDTAELEDFYRNLKLAIEEYGIQLADMWNMDETGFRIGVGRSKMVISFDKYQRNYIADPDNRDYCTAVESISADGATIPPLIILKAANVLLKWSQHNNLENECQLGATKSGYSNDDLAVDWLQHFIDSVKKGRIGRYILLIVDGFGSHMTLSFFNLATANNIILFKLPAHSTHITQPLDVGVFQPYKAAHGNAIEKAIRNGDAKYNRLEFLAALREIRASVFVQGTIRNAWRRCGIAPLNPDVVLNPLRTKAAEKAAARPTTPPRQLDDCLMRTPHGDRSITRNIQAIRIHYNVYGNYNINPIQMDRFLKGSEAAVHTLRLHTRDLNTALKATAKRNTRNSLPGWRAKTSGIITVGDCREQFSERAMKEAAAAERKAKREAAKAEKAAQANAQAEEAQADEESEEEENTEEEVEEEEEDNTEAEAEEEEEDNTEDEEEDTEVDTPPQNDPRPQHPSVDTPYVVYRGTTNRQDNETIYDDLISAVAVIGGKRVRKPSRKALEKDSDSSPSPSPPPPRRRRRQNPSPD